jgi:hypothetical protein
MLSALRRRLGEARGRAGIGWCLIALSLLLAGCGQGGQFGGSSSSQQTTPADMQALAAKALMARVAVRYRLSGFDAEFTHLSEVFASIPSEVMLAEDGTGTFALIIGDKFRLIQNLETGIDAIVCEERERPYECRTDDPATPVIYAIGMFGPSALFLIPEPSGVAEDERPFLAQSRRTPDLQVAGREARCAQFTPGGWPSLDWFFSEGGDGNGEETSTPPKPYRVSVCLDSQTGTALAITVNANGTQTAMTAVTVDQNPDPSLFKPDRPLTGQ